MCRIIKKIIDAFKFAKACEPSHNRFGVSMCRIIKRMIDVKFGTACESLKFDATLVAFFYLFSLSGTTSAKAFDLQICGRARRIMFQGYFFI